MSAATTATATASGGARGGGAGGGGGGGGARAASRRVFAGAQRLGRALMLPIAVLPVAGLLLRLGQPDLLDVPLVAQSGKVLFDSLPLLFAIGVAVGFASENHGVAALAAAVGYLILTASLHSMNPAVNMGVLSGIISGLVAGALYNRTKDIRLPSYLSFFGGKRFVAIATGVVCLGLGVGFGVVWPPVQDGINGVGAWLLGAGALGLFVYGVLNRLLLVTGLHHILNTLVWFVFGSYAATGGHVATGDLNRFFAGDPTAGAFMAGFFPVMMFGLPAACLAMYRSARPENRKGAGSLLLSIGLTSGLTGVTEPVEFSFMFQAPVLYLLHALLCGASMVLMHVLGVRLGFTFSAGAFDFALSAGLGARAWLLLPVGLGYFAIYYGLFRFAIQRFDLMTPGREPPGEGPGGDAGGAGGPVTRAGGDRARAFVAALGGADNLVSIDACTTRLRLQVVDGDAIDDKALARLGARGVVRPAAGSVQVVLGPEADQVADRMRQAVRDRPEGSSPAAPAHRARADQARADQPPAADAADVGPASGPEHRETAAAAVDRAAWLEALGGADNVEALEQVATSRIRVVLADASRLREPALIALGAPAVQRLPGGVVHILAGTRAGDVAAALTQAD